MGNQKIFKIRRIGSSNTNSLFASDRRKAEMKVRMLIESKKMLIVNVKRTQVNLRKVNMRTVRKPTAKRTQVRIR